MARKIPVRVVVNRRAITAAREGFVAGMEDIGQRVLALGEGKIPDATPFGEGLVTTSDYGIWVDGKKVAGGATKPRRVVAKQGVTLIVGYGFPGRFQSLGTTEIAPNPDWFVTPMNEVLPGTGAYLKAPVKAALAKVR